MSESNDTIFVCPNDDNETELIDTFAIVIAVLTSIGAVIGYFMQQNRERKDAAEAKEKEDADLDREQALERARHQMAVFIGPMHRSFKVYNTIISHYILSSGHGIASFAKMLETKGQSYWASVFDDEFLAPFIDDPHSFEAVKFRNFIVRQMKPIYSKIRGLILDHMSDLADMPTQEEWLTRWTAEAVTSPYNGSINVNVIFDTYCAWTLEFDDIIESWMEEDYRRMQPDIRFAGMICNDLVDLLYDNAKEKEARYNKHVKVHRNTLQLTDDNKVKQSVIYEKLAKLTSDREVGTEGESVQQPEKKIRRNLRTRMSVRW